MEDSYTVHRRRKASAAARRRDKTPEAPRRPLDEDDSKDEAREEARARMERMVEDTERMEALHNNEQPKSEEQVEEIKQVKSVEEHQAHIVQAPTDHHILEDSKVTEIVETENRTESAKRTRETSRRRAKRSQERWSTSDSGADDDKSSKSEAERYEKKREKKPRRLRKESAHRSDNNETTRSRKSLNSEEPIAPPRVSKSSHSEDSSSLRPVPHRSSHSDDSINARKSHSEELSSSRSRKSSNSEEPEVFRSKRKSSVNEDRSIDPSITHATKQIIPLSNDSLFHDLEIAQQKYGRRQMGILDADDEDYGNVKRETVLRKRKRNKSRKDVEDTSPPKEEEGESVKSSNFWSWLRFFKSKETKEKTDEIVEPELIEEKVEEKNNEIKRESKFFEYLRILSEIRTEFKIYVIQNPRETSILRKNRNRCIAELLLIIIYCGLGAFIFRFTEGSFEQFYKCGVKRVKRDFLDSLWNYSHNMKEDDWKSMARRKLMEFEEQLYVAYDAGLHTYSGQKSWSFLNAFVYCLTVITTIGYGHIYPTTPTGQAMTIVYAIFGIPMFLIILADFGKLFTRGMKFLWAFVRRVYYTGSCRKVRRTAPVQEVMKGVQLVYDFATFRRPSQMTPEDIEEMSRQQTPQTILNVDGNIPPQQPDTPGTPALSTFEIDDEFNLPISVAITLLLAYIFVGATAYHIWEDWNFFQSFYFVFISMSTIGFGDFVPKHPIYMMCSIVYLVFGLALTSMCINVVQVMLSDSFKQASQKIGATIGFEVAVDDGSIQTTAPPPVEVADVHATIKEEDEFKETKQAPRAKEEEVDL